MDTKKCSGNCEQCERCKKIAETKTRKTRKFIVRKKTLVPNKLERE